MNFADQIIFRIIGLVIGDIITILFFYYYYKRIKNDETKSIVYEIKEELEAKYLNKEEINKNDIEKNNGNDKDKDDNKIEKIQDEEKVILNEEQKKEDNNMGDKENTEEKDEFTLYQKIALLIFVLGFIIMVLGVVLFNWWFEEMSSLFILIGIILMFLSRFGEENSLKVFLKRSRRFL